MDVMNQVLQIIIKFCTIGGGLWCVWGVIVLAGALKDKMHQLYKVGYGK